mmetsp:Transcript_17279/g.24964  ORF Transcript_17279/g.24964 Transcript_17279/m.24964 type:complete len:336 (+) Transcript_17279:148-1155(+)
MIMCTAKDPSTTADLIKDPSPVDVLCGKQGPAFTHPGNKRFRQIILENLPNYISAPNKTAKSKVVKAVYAEFMQLGTRFLKADSKSGRWYAIEPHEAREKVSHSFRDRVRERTRAAKKRKENANAANSVGLKTLDLMTKQAGAHQMLLNQRHLSSNMYLSNAFASDNLTSNIRNSSAADMYNGVILGEDSSSARFSDTPTLPQHLLATHEMPPIFAGSQQGRPLFQTQRQHQQGINEFSHIHNAQAYLSLPTNQSSPISSLLREGANTSQERDILDEYNDIPLSELNAATGVLKGGQEELDVSRDTVSGETGGESNSSDPNTNHILRMVQRACEL